MQEVLAVVELGEEMAGGMAFEILNAFRSLRFLKQLSHIFAYGLNLVILFHHNVQRIT